MHKGQRMTWFRFKHGWQWALCVALNGVLLAVACVMLGYIGYLMATQKPILWSAHTQWGAVADGLTWRVQWHATHPPRNPLVLRAARGLNQALEEMDFWDWCERDCLNRESKRRNCWEDFSKGCALVKPCVIEISRGCVVECGSERYWESR